MGLYGLERQSKNGACVSAQIELGLARLDLCPLGHEDHTAILNDLAWSFDSRYGQEGNILDLNRAIEVAQKRLDLCPLDHSEHADAIGWLAICSWKHYLIQESETDLNRLVQMVQKWYDLCLSQDLGHEAALAYLAASLWARYNKHGDEKDLDQAIDMEEKWVDLCPSGDPDYPDALGNLAESLNTRYNIYENLTDLNRAINLKQRRLDLCHSNHPDHGLALWSLASSLQARYYKLENLSDLTRAARLLKRALNNYPVQHSHFAPTASQLSTILLLLNSSQSNDSPNQSLQLLDEAFETYRQLKKCGPAVSVDLWNATQAWIRDAEEYKHPSVLEAYQTSLNTLDHFTSFNSSLDSRHGVMQAWVADLANNAFSCATRHGDFKMAVELLEQGRGILWNQLARFDSSIAALESLSDQGRTLGNKFARLNGDLRKHAEGSGDENIDPYWRVQEEWQSTLDEIRRLDGFSRFLFPPRFDDLQQAAKDGPIIIVNASEYSCDAVIVLGAEPPVHVPLPCSLADVIQLCGQLSELTEDPNAYGKNRESWVKQMLRELWYSVVEPIVIALQNDLQLPTGSRIWWCPTSKLTVLPFHAAGPHRKVGKNLMDIYVSSYAPSLSALIRTRDRVRLQKEVRDASGSANVISFAAVGQAQPSKDTKLSNLPEVQFEINKIRNETNMPPDMKFETVTGAAATIEGAIQAFRDHRWVHLACHGAQHAKKPFESWFAMGDGKLTLMRIIQERYTNSEFAFLSACHTALGDASTPDEVLHLAAGMQFAGFNGVIGTLWRVDDAVAHQVVTRFYTEMFNRPAVDFEYAATALNMAAVDTAGEVSLEKRVVFVHIGI